MIYNTVYKIEKITDSNGKKLKSYTAYGARDTTHYRVGDYVVWFDRGTRGVDFPYYDQGGNIEAIVYLRVVKICNTTSQAFTVQHALRMDVLAGMRKKAQAKIDWIDSEINRICVERLRQ